METGASLQYLQQSLSLVAEESVLEIVRVLGRIGSGSLKAKAAQILLDFFGSRHPIVETIAIKQALAHAWGQLGEESAVEPLLQLREDAEARVRWQAYAALKHFSFAD